MQSPPKRPHQIKGTPEYEAQRIRSAEHYKKNKEKVADRGRANAHKYAEKKSAQQKATYVAKRDAFLEKARKYRSKNKAKISERRAEIYKKNPQPLRDAANAWKRANPEFHRAHDAARRARKVNAAGTHTASDIKQILSLQRGLCPVCKSDIANGFHVDHVVPLARGGGNEKLNIQLLCAPCNWSKHAKDPLEFMQQKGFLI